MSTFCQAVQMLSANSSAPRIDVLFGAEVREWRVSGLTFVGGKNQLHIGNNNTDKSQIVIQGCSFFGAYGAAIRLLEPSAQPPGVAKQRQAALAADEVP